MNFAEVAKRQTGNLTENELDFLFLEIANKGRSIKPVHMAYFLANFIDKKVISSRDFVEIEEGFSRWTNETFLQLFDRYSDESFFKDLFPKYKS